VNNLHIITNFIQITQQTKLRVAPVALVVSNVSSRAVRQARHSQNACARHVERVVSCRDVTSQVEFGVTTLTNTTSRSLKSHSISLIQYSGKLRDWVTISINYSRPVLCWKCFFASNARARACCAHKLLSRDYVMQVSGRSRDPLMGRPQQHVTSDRVHGKHWLTKRADLEHSQLTADHWSRRRLHAHAIQKTTSINHARY